MVREDLVLASGVLDQALLVVKVGQLVVDLELGVHCFPIRLDVVDQNPPRDQPAVEDLQVERIEVPSGTLTLVDSLQLEGGEEFMWTEDLPDTPDDFGGEEGVNFTGAPPVMFTSDG